MGTLAFVSVLALTAFTGPLVIDHSCTDLAAIPAEAINQAKAALHVAYGHTSHGSQLTTGMTALDGQTDLLGYKGDIYTWSDSGGAGVLELHDYYGSFPGGAADLGNPDFTTWATATRDYLNDSENAGINVIMWSWCGQLSWASAGDVDNYLALMSALEADFPNVTFVYMTGHSDYWSDAGIKASNQRIRTYCAQHGKVLYDFNDIESYDPDGQHYEYVGDDCSYYADLENTLLGNWAQEWQDAHEEGVYWYQCESAHSEPLNANRKAYAAWWLFARLAGWPGPGGQGTPPQAQFTVRPQVGQPPLQVTFTDTSVPGSAPIETWAWDFGDGQHLEGDEPNPGHVYDEPGRYTVTLTVTSDAGSSTIVKTKIILAAESLPVATGLSGVLLCGVLASLMKKRWRD